MKTAVPGLIIRPFELKDLHNIYMLGAGEPVFSAMIDKWTPENLAHIFSGDDVTAFTASRKKEIAGCGIARIIDNSAEVLRIMVKEKFRRKGIGSALLSILKDTLKMKGVPCLSARVYPENQDIETFFIRNSLTLKENFTRLSGKI